MNIFEVGGAVRDEVMGRRSKDVDFSVITDSFESMERMVTDAGMKIVQSKPEFATIRAVAKTPFRGHKGGLDFVWARKDGPSSDGRRPDWVEPGTLEDDLSRRDFTINSLAKDESGGIIDLFGGINDIHLGIIRTVGDAETRFTEDGLRILRGVRFAVVLGFEIESHTANAMRNFRETLAHVSVERVREEMEKAFSHDTLRTLELLEWLHLTKMVFSRGLRISPTLAQ